MAEGGLAAGAVVRDACAVAARVCTRVASRRVVGEVEVGAGSTELAGVVGLEVAVVGNTGQTVGGID